MQPCCSDERPALDESDISSVPHFWCSHSYDRDDHTYSLITDLDKQAVTAVKAKTTSADAVSNSPTVSGKAHVAAEAKADAEARVESGNDEAELLSTDDEEFGFQTDDASVYSHSVAEMSMFCHLCRRRYPEGSKTIVCTNCHSSYCATCATRQDATEAGCACCPESDHCCHRCSLKRTEVLARCKLATPLSVPCIVLPDTYWIQSGSVTMETNLELVGAQVRIWMSDGSQNTAHQCSYEHGLVRAYAPAREEFLVEIRLERKIWMRLVWRVEGKDDPRPHVFTETEAAIAPLDYKLTGEQQPRICYVLPDKDVFCYCRSSEDGECVQCDLCDEWYHGACTGLDAVALEALKNDSTLSFHCLICQLFPETRKVNSVQISAGPDDKSPARPYSMQKDSSQCELGSRLRRRALSCSQHLKNRSTLRRLLYCTPAELVEAHARHPPKPPLGAATAEKIGEYSKVYPGLEPSADTVTVLDATSTDTPTAAALTNVTTAIAHRCKNFTILWGKCVHCRNACLPRLLNPPQPLAGARI